MKKGLKNTMTTIGVVASLLGIGTASYMYLTKNKRKIDKYMSYLDNK